MSKKLRVGINGLGRIGRAIFRINHHQGSRFEVAAVNDLDPNVENLAYLLKYDSTYGRFPATINVNGNVMSVDDHAVEFHSHASITDVPWEKAEVDVVIDATGVYKNVQQAHELTRSGRAKKVIITHSPKEVDFTLIYGANEENYDPGVHHVISTSICDANAIAPVMRVVLERFGLKEGLLTTLHPWLSYQNLVDAPIGDQSHPGMYWKDFSLGRSSIGNLIPKNTTAVEAVLRVLPQLKGRLDAISYRVPTGIVASCDMNLVLEKPTTAQEINSVFKEVARTRSQVFGYSEDALTSIDLLRSPYSVVVDGRWTRIVGNSLAKLVLWYDNEWGYSQRVVDAVAACLPQPSPDKEGRPVVR